MNTSLEVTFFDDEDMRQYHMQIDRNDDYIEVYIARSVVLDSNPGDHNRQEPEESATYTWTWKAMEEYHKKAPTVFDPSINGITNLLEAVGLEWANVFGSAV